MFQTLTKGITFDEFLEWYPDGYGRCSDRLISNRFSKLTLTAEQIFNAGR